MVKDIKFHSQHWTDWFVTDDDKSYIQDLVYLTLGPDEIYGPYEANIPIGTDLIIFTCSLLERRIRGPMVLSFHFHNTEADWDNITVSGTPTNFDITFLLQEQVVRRK